VTDTSIVDAHAHAWPRLADHPGYADQNEHMAFAQRHSILHIQGARRSSDGAEVHERTLFDGRGSGQSNLYDVNFHIGRFGRFEWTHAGIDYYMQWMPPTMQDMANPPEMMLAHMDYVGVHWGVLSGGHTYGRSNQSNDYQANCVRRFPNRFAGVAQIDEWCADTPEQISELRRAIKDLGLKALFYDTESFFRVDNSLNFDDARFNGFWQAVLDLGIPVQWYLAPRQAYTPDDFAAQLTAFHQWVKRYPNIPSVFTHAFDMQWFPEQRLTPQVIAVAREPSVYLELLFPIMNGRHWEYPFPEVRPVLRQLREEMGTARLLWGSDMPAVERVCTYKQSLDYLRHQADFMPPGELQAILGGNAARLYGLG